MAKRRIPFKHKGGVSLLEIAGIYAGACVANLAIDYALGTANPSGTGPLATIQSFNALFMPLNVLTYIPGVSSGTGSSVSGLGRIAPRHAKVINAQASPIRH